MGVQQYASWAIRTITEEYPAIKLKDMKLFGVIQYPVAEIEMNLQEENYEDYDKMEFYVLRMYRGGLHSSEEIAEAMGLSPAYVARILNMIMGYKHIRDGRITELGLDSLENGRKKTLIPARQLMQADAVTGNLLEIDRNVPAVRLHELRNSKGRVIIANHPKMIYRHTIEAAIHDFYEKYKDMSGMLHSNVEKINSIEVQDVKYTSGIMLLHKKFRSPVVFLDMIGPKDNAGRRNSRPQPVSVPDEGMIRYFGFSEDIPVTTNDQQRYIDYVIPEIEATEVSEERLLTDLEFMIPMNHLNRSDMECHYFDPAGIHIRRSGDGKYRCIMSADAICGYSDHICNMLLDLAADGEEQIVLPNAMCYLVSLIPDPDDDMLNRILDKLKHYCDSMERGTCKSILDNEMKNVRSGDVVNDIYEVLQSGEFEKYMA